MKSETTTHGQELHWTRRVLAADDLRHNLNGHLRLVLLPGTVVTPLAAEELRHRGIEVAIGSATVVPASDKTAWGCGQDQKYAIVQSALQALARDQVAVKDLPVLTDEDVPRWARAVAECVGRGDCCGGVLFCQDPALVCCIANKLPGLRAAAVTTVAQAARAVLTLGANVLAVEMPGRTFFEVRQILRQFCAGSARSCPERAAAVLKELEGHAHR